MTQAFEVGGKIRSAVTAAEFDDADGLAGGSRALGKLVKLGHLNRSEGGALAARAKPFRAALIGPRRESGVGLRAIIEPEDSLNRTVSSAGKWILPSRTR